MVKMAKDAKVLITGKGFKPGQEIAILYTDVNGATADLEAYLDPKEVKADASGNWSVTWKCGRYISKKLIKQGVSAVRVTDSDYTLLAHASIAFQKGDVSVSGKPPMVAATPSVKMGKGAKVTIDGKGFKPGQEIAILYTDVNGATADLEAYLDPKEIKADASGNWSAVWKCGRYISKKLIKKGVSTIRVTDRDYTLLAHASISFE
jgi:hypothetical protein